MKNDKKVIAGWAMYDWANSAYSLVVTSTIFPAYYDAVTTSKDINGNVISHRVSFLGFTLESAALYNFTIAFSYIFIALLSPMLSSFADRFDSKKKFMRFFCYIGSIACMGMFWFTKETLGLGITMVMIATLGFCGSQVFYNAFLPEIADNDQQDSVSAKGFAYGYVGSVLLQLICFVFVLKPELFHITDASFPARFSFLLTGLWWLGFAQISFARLPVQGKKESFTLRHLGKSVFEGYVKLANTFKTVSTLAHIKKYLAAFFFYSMGVQTVMLAATLFGSQELQLPTSSLILCILVIQILAIGGAYFMANLSNKIGNLNVLALVVAIWTGVCIVAYFIHTQIQFFILAGVVGFIMGGIQSLSRSTYSKFLPYSLEEHTSFFSFYDVCEKVSIVGGMLSFGIIQQITGSMRNSILALILFFMTGFWLLLGLKKFTAKRLKG